MMGGYGQGHGMGPGMMGGYGQGHGMGPGMMGGYGQGYGMGPGMMGYGGAPGLSLSDEQRTKAMKIQDGTRKKMWESMGAMFDASGKLRELLSDSTRDRAAISAAYKQVAELRQKMFEAGVDAQEEFERILTADQQKLLRR
ncbi:MAG: periplasmic heavy metal sensor [Burkholderiales bacterium]|nr:periplasmic heavy metal sensor [Burkholderiales bacterium]